MPDREPVKPLRIDWDKTRCTNCLSCMVVCSERHIRVSAPSRAHLRIVVDLLESDYALGARDAEYCRQCQAAPCVAACPSEAFWLDEQVRAWRVDQSLCLACGACVEACPYHAIRLDPVTDQATKCDLCLGACRCVEICSTNALTVRETEF